MNNDSSIRNVSEMVRLHFQIMCVSAFGTLKRKMRTRTWLRKYNKCKCACVHKHVCVCVCVYSVHVRICVMTCLMWFSPPLLFWTLFPCSPALFPHSRYFRLASFPLQHSSRWGPFFLCLDLFVLLPLSQISLAPSNLFPVLQCLYSAFSIK